MNRFIIMFAGLLGFSALIAQEVQWISIEDAAEKVKDEPRKILIDVYTDWCKWCKVMDQNTFSHPKISEYLESKYYTVKLNAESRQDITFNGQTFKYVAEGSRGYHELAAALLNGKMSYPSVVFMDENLNIIQPVAGYIQPKQFDYMINFIGDEHYKTSTWEDFQSSYQSKIE